MNRVLVVDDSLTVRMDLAEALEAADFVVEQAPTLADARRALRDGTIALIILDVRLPDGDGVDLLREVRASSELPIMMLSSEAEVADRIRGLKTGANDYVGKPYDASLVVARARQLVAQAPDRKLVLVIDDSATFRNVLVATLVAAGYHAISASSGADGLRAAAAHRPGAIIVDGVMPDMKGDAVIRRIRLDPALRTTPCLLLTGSDDAAAEVMALDAGADAFARKDADVDIILARFGAMLRSARDTRPLEGSGLIGTKRVLAVDDSATYLAAIAEQLQTEGFDVVQATSGHDAIELLAVQPVDCILLDLVMPGMSGIEACRRIKAALRDTPLIALTAQDGRDVMIESLSAGADDFVSKSAGGEVVAARVKAQIRRKRFADEYRDVRERLLRSEQAEALARANAQLADANRALAATNQELEAFSYSVSHDLRAPLRRIDGFSNVLLDDTDSNLSDSARDYLGRIRTSVERMSELIDDLLQLARVSRGDLQRERVDVSAMVNAVIANLRQSFPDHAVESHVRENVVAVADARLLQIVLENLLGNAWKFTTKVAAPRVEFGVDDGVYFVRDNGAGFDMSYAERLFAPFQRLHTDHEFPGTGIGLATVRRILGRHGGRIWAESAPDRGATFSFTLSRGSE